MIFWAKDENDIHDMAIKLHEAGVDLEQEGDAAGFLGVTLECNDKNLLIEMLQYGMIDRIVEALVINDGMVTKYHTPLEGKPLVTDKDRTPDHGKFNDGSVLVMMIYMLGHTCPDIAYPLHFCDKYRFALTQCISYP